MFGIGIRYLNGWAMAKFPANHEMAEWPPHPDRVFMALTASCAEFGFDEAQRQCLEWMERQPPPAVIASECHWRDIVTVHVPVNDDSDPAPKKKPQTAKGTMPLGRSHQPRQFPVAVPHNPTVYLVWEDGDPPGQLAGAFETLCAQVGRVGHSASFVQMWVEPRPPLEPERLAAQNLKRFVPSGNMPARFRLRVPGAGRLAQLEALYNKESHEEYFRLKDRIEDSSGKEQKALKKAMKDHFGDSPPMFQYPKPSLWQGYNEHQPPPEPESLPFSRFDPAVIVLRKTAGPPMGLESTLKLTKTLRDTILSALAGSGAPIPEWVSGHAPDGSPSENDHLALFPLAHVGREHAAGHIMGFALAAPRELGATGLRGFLYDEYGRPRTIQLKLGRLGVWTLDLPDTDSRVALRAETWTAAAPAKPARVWGTVTPIALDRYPKGKDPWDEISAIIKNGCRRIGLPEPCEAVPSKVSPFIGAPIANRFPAIQRKPPGGNVYHTHATLIFPEPVRGPVLVGAGRYRGYGLCRPLDGGTEDES